MLGVLTHHFHLALPRRFFSHPPPFSGGEYFKMNFFSSGGRAFAPLPRTPTPAKKKKKTPSLEIDLNSYSL